MGLVLSGVARTYGRPASVYPPPFMSNTTAGPSVDAPFVAPYRPSWVDRFFDRLDRSPVPVWVAYLSIYLVAAALMHLAVWNDGVVAWGHPDLQQFAAAGWSIVFLVFIHHLEHVADRALERFAPLGSRKPAEFAALRYRMTAMPARTVLVLQIPMACLVVGLFLSQPAFLYEGASRPLSMALGSIIIGWSYSFAPVLLFYGVRLLTSVRAAFRLVETVDLYEQQPLYAFSGLTLQASLFWIFLLNVDLAQTLFTESTRSALVVGWLFGGPMTVVAALTFVLPLTGIHRRLADEKQRLIEENGVRVANSQRALYAALSGEEYEKVDRLDRSITLLDRVKNQIRDIPTWPWRAGTLRNFLTAVFVPMMLWVLQQVGSSLIK